MRRRGIVIGAVVILVVGGFFAYSQRVTIRDAFTRKPEVPAAIERAAVVADVNANTGNTNTAGEPEPLPAVVNLKVPFASQAPHANWDHDHEEFCEEAAVLMVGLYWQDRGIKDKDEAEAALQQLKKWQNETLGKFESTTAEETARVLKEFYELSDVVVLTNPTVDDLKREIAAGHPVIVPAAGRLLGNPNFRRPGPLYHMLVVKGFRQDGTFITNDPGTRKGADYVYAPDVIMNAMHDWNGGDVENGQKVIIVVRSK